MLQLLMGLKVAGNIRNPCVFCLFHAQSNERYTRLEWEKRDEFIVGQHSVENPPLILSKDIILPVLHLKLGIFKQFIKYLKNDAAISIVGEMFPRTSTQKVTAGIFTGPQVDKIIEDDGFISALTEEENACRKAILDVLRHVLVPSDFSVMYKRQCVDNMISRFRNLEVNYSPKLHYVDIHLPELLSRQFVVSDQHGERLHQTFKTFDVRYSNKSLTKMILDYLWSKLD